MTVSHEGQQRVRWVREEFRDSTGNVTDVEWRQERDGAFVWSQGIHPDIEAAILASVLPDPRVTALMTAARENSRFRLDSETFWRCGACTEPVDQCGCGMHEIRAALRAFDDKPDEEVERG